MSLKFFHIVFIVLSVSLAFSFALWAINIHYQEQNIPYLALGILSLASGIGLVVYGNGVMKKISGLLNQGTH